MLGAKKSARKLYCPFYVLVVYIFLFFVFFPAPTMCSVNGTCYIIALYLEAYPELDIFMIQALVLVLFNIRGESEMIYEFFF